jgi:hypothetical protein
MDKKALVAAAVKQLGAARAKRRAAFLRKHR